jgi:hypothetical protein
MLVIQNRLFPFLTLTEHHTMKSYVGVEVELHSFLTSALVEDELSAARPDRFTLLEGDFDAYYIRGWIEPRAGLNYLLAACFSLLYRVAYSSTLKMVATCFSEKYCHVFLSARGNNKRGFSGFNSGVYCNNC